MSKKFFSVLFLSIAISFSGCYDDDDWSPYERYSREIGVTISLEYNTLFDLVPEIDRIANSQQENLVLTSIIMHFIGQDELVKKSGTIIFVYSGESDKKNQMSIMNIHFNMENMMIEKFDWEKGHVKRVGGNTKKIGDKYIDYSIAEFFSLFETDNNYLFEVKKINPSLRINLQFDRLYVYLYYINIDEPTPVFTYYSEIED